MAAKSLGTLTLDLVAKIGGFTGPLEKAKRTTKKQMGDIAGSAKTAATAIAGVGAAAGAAGFAVVAFTNNAAQNARELKNQAQVANASVEEFQALGYASNQVGIEQDKLSDILKDVNDRVGDFMATGGGPMADFFEQIAPKIGVTAEEFRNLSGPQALQLYYDSLEKANLSQADMTFYLEAMASDTTALIPLLKDGGAGFSEMADEADRLGIVLSGMDIAKLDEFASQFDRITGILSASGQVIAAELAPYISVLGDYFVEAAESAGGLSVIVHDFIETSLDGLGVILDAWREFEIVVTTMQWAFKKVEVASDEMANALWQSLAPVFDFYVEQVNILIDGVNALGANIENLPAYSDTEFLAQFPERVKESKEELWELAWALHDLENSVPPSEMLDKFGEDVVAKVDEIRESLKEGGPIIPPQIMLPSGSNQSGSPASESGVGTDDESMPLGFMNEAKLDEQLDYWAQWLEGASEAVNSFDEIAGETIDNFSQRFGEAFESMIFDSQSLGDAVYNLADGMARSVVSALGEMAAQWLAYQAVQMLVGTTTQSSAAATQTANAMAMSQMAALNAFASTAAIPIVGPVAAPGAAAAAMAATAPMAAAVASLSMAGMAHDGIDNIPTEGTWLLDKGERVMSRPQADKLDQYLAKQQGGGGGLAPIINITHEGSQQATTRERQDSDGRWVIDVLIADASSDGRFARTQQKTYGLQRKGR